MSGILAVVGQVRDSLVESAMAPLRYLGGEREQIWSEADTIVAVTRKQWQLDDDFCGDILVLESPDLVVAADASLFDKKGLARKLSTAGVRANGNTPSHLIEAAYRAWGTALVEHLSGDYAFVVWDRRERRLLAARDPIGGRPLYCSRIGSGIAIASSARALAELRGGAQELNLANLAGQAAGLAWSNGIDTAYRWVDTLRPGRRLTWRDAGVSVESFWIPRAKPESGPSPMDQAAEELRDLLSTAVAHRLGSGTTTVWMSGGWDSTAVFGAGQHVLPLESRGRLCPVSISYPVGDPGREDELIDQVAAHWNAQVCWVRSEDLGLLEDLEERSARCDEPPAHLYELWNRGLARGTRSLGARVTLDGAGGDQLFQVSDIILADMLAGGRWGNLIRIARSRRPYGRNHLIRHALLPFIPAAVLRQIEHLAGRRVPLHYLERPRSGWVREEFALEEGLWERDLEVLRSVRGSSHAQTENLLYLTMPVWSWGGSFMRGALLDEGVEARSPLLDLKVVDFALSRPVAERADGRETKILLRRAMRGLLPAEVLAPRTHRTGVTVGFSSRKMREGYPALINQLFAGRLRLADLGIVDEKALRDAAKEYLSGHRGDYLRVNLFHTMKIEFWLRGLERRGTVIAPPAEIPRVVAEFPAA